MMTIHEERAREQAAVEGLAARSSARQGDLVLRRMGDAADDAGRDTGPVGVVLIAGRHGEHRVIAPAAIITEGKLSLPRGGLVVHTDEPAGRHAPIRLAPGVWQFAGQRELESGAIVRVSD